MRRKSNLARLVPRFAAALAAWAAPGGAQVAVVAKSRDKALGYIDDFYAVLADPKNIGRAFRLTCAG